MNIESRAFRLRGDIPGLPATVEITAKASGMTAFVPRANVLHAQLSALQARLNDPATPDRPSDIARLVQERDAARAETDRARAQLAAVAERGRALQAALDKAAHDIDGLASRVAVAEAAVRRSMAA